MVEISQKISLLPQLSSGQCIGRFCGPSDNKVMVCPSPVGTGVQVAPRKSLRHPNDCIQTDLTCVTRLLAHRRRETLPKYSKFGRRAMYSRFLLSDRSARPTPADGHPVTGVNCTSVPASWINCNGPLQRSYCLSFFVQGTLINLVTCDMQIQ